MNTHHERFQICLQCIEEKHDPYFFYDYTREVTVDDIREMIKMRITWKNPLRFQWTGPSAYKLCKGCCYVLEHTVLAGREVSEF